MRVYSSQCSESAARIHALLELVEARVQYGGCEGCAHRQEQDAGGHGIC